MKSTESSQLVKWTVCLLGAVAVTVMIIRIATVRAKTGETAMLSANDRSRWCTIRALVDRGTYQIDDLIRLRHPETQRRFWSTIDRVRHKGWDRKEHDFSSKPPLLPTMIAGEYWVIHRMTGATLGDHPFFVMRSMLVLTNVVPMIIYFWILWRLVGALTTHTGTRLFVLTVALWGTFLTTFTVTLNNHLVAAVSVLAATACAHAVWVGRSANRYYFGAGLFAAFAAANELPALSFLACIGLALMWRSWRTTMISFVPAVVLVAAAFFGTNYAAHGTWVPAYAHRHDGPVQAEFDNFDTEELEQATIPDRLRNELKPHGIELSEQAIVLPDNDGRRWVLWDRVGQKRFALVAEGGQLSVHRWNNWYDYPGSYWKGKQAGVDRGEPSRLVYALHSLVGHHGIFSLTPVWFLSMAGLFLLARGTLPEWRSFAWMVLLLMVVCLAFYIARPEGDRNYGGVSCGFRWMFWFIPLWTVAMVPAVERLLANKRGWVTAGCLLLLSIFSASYAGANPWSHPWILDLGNLLGWWHY